MLLSKMPKLLQCHRQPRAPQKISILSVNDGLEKIPKFYENDPCIQTISFRVTMEVQSTRFAYRFQALKLNQIKNIKFINYYGKANRETHALAQWHMIGHRLFVSEPIGNVFYLQGVGPLNPSWYGSVDFSYLLNFCR